MSELKKKKKEKEELYHGPNPPSESLADLNMTPMPLGQLNEEYKKFDPDGKKAMALAKKYRQQRKKEGK